MSRAGGFCGLILLFALVLTHYILWVQVTEPVPISSGLTRYHNPVLNYFKAARITDNDPGFLKNAIFTNEIPDGVLLISWYLFDMGLDKLLLSEPYWLGVIGIIPFVISAFFFSGNFKERLLNGLIIIFFPLTQICIKQLCLSGVALAYLFVALLFFRSWLLYRRLGLLCGFLLFSWFAALLHSVVLSLLCCLSAVYLFWSIRNDCFDWRVLSVILLSLFCSLPFCSINVLTHYSIFFRIIFPRFINGWDLLLWSCFLFLFLPVISGFYMRKRQISACRGVRPDKIFRNGLNLILLLTLFFHVVGSRFLSVEAVLFYGSGILCWCLFLQSFRGIRGMLYLYILVSAFYLFLFYAAFFEYASFSLLFLPLFLILTQTLSENKSLFFRIFLLLLCIITSNFFPDYAQMNALCGNTGKGIYTNIFGSTLYNPLGWQNYGFGAFFREFTDKISKRNFAQEPIFVAVDIDFFLMPYFSALSAFSLEVPELMLLERGESFSELYQQYQDRGEIFFVELFERGEIPLLLYTDIAEPDGRGYYPENKGAPVVTEFSGRLLEYFRNSGRQQTDYECYAMPADKPLAELCIDKRSGSGGNFSHKKRVWLKERWAVFLLDKVDSYYEKRDIRQVLRVLRMVDDLDLDSAEIRERKTKMRFNLSKNKAW